MESLADFLTDLSDRGELRRIPVSVTAEGEWAEVVDRTCHHTAPGPALLFEQLSNSPFPMVTNLLGSERRLCLGLECESLAQFHQRCTALLKHLPVEKPASEGDVTTGIGSWLSQWSTPGATRSGGKGIKTAGCQQVVKIGRDVDLHELPWPRFAASELHGQWPLALTTFRYFTSANGAQGATHITSAAVEFHDSQSLLLHWNADDSMHQTLQATHRAGRQFPVAIAVGGDPALLLAAQFPRFPQGTGWEWIEGLRQEPPALVKCRTQDLEIPAHAELVIEGFIDAQSPLISSSGRVLPDGTIASKCETPLMQVTAVTHRSTPIIPIVAVGNCPSEFTWHDRAIERVQLAMLQRHLPQLTGLRYLGVTPGRNVAEVRIEKQSPGDGRRILHALWGSPVMNSARCLIVVDETANRDAEKSLWPEIAANVDFQQDLLFNDTPFVSETGGTKTTRFARRLGIDATVKWAQEVPQTRNPVGERSAEIRELVSRRWGEYGL